jgi:putative ABC transport system permease protein
MTPTLFKTALRDQLRRPWLTLLMILSVALGVAVVVSVDLANASATRAFKLSTDAVVGKATHQILGGSDGIDERVYRDLRVQDGYRLSAPIVEGYASAKELNNQTMHVLGVDLFAEPPFRTYLTANTQVPLDAFAAFLTQPNSVLISADTAARFGLKVGDQITLAIDTHERAVTIVGLLRPPNDVSSRALEGLLLTDISTAQELFGMVGRLSRIDLIATPAQAAQIAATLPSNLRVVPASEQANTVTQLTAAFQLNLTAFSLLALAVGMFLIYNTTLFSVVQRRRVLGILRCVGVTGREIFAMILIEAAIAGAIGSVIGLGLGILLGRVTVGLVTQTINDLYFSVTVQSVDVDSLSLIKGLILGIGAAVLAAALPASEAASVPAVTVLQRSDLESRVRRGLPAFTFGGIGLIAVGAALIEFVPNSVAVSFAGIFIALFGVTLGVPALTVALMRLATATFGRVGLIGRMAARTVTQALSRTSVAIAALMVAISVVIGVTVMIASFRATVENWLQQTLIADVYISPPLQGPIPDATTLAPHASAGVNPALADKVRAVPGVSSVDLVHYSAAHSQEFGDVRLTAVTTLRNRILKSSNVSDAAARVQSGAVIVSEPFATRHHVQPGDHITLMTDHGAQTFPIVGIYYDYSSDQGMVLMTLDTYRRFWDDESVSAIAVYLARGANQNQVEDAIRAALGGTDVVVQSNQALRDAALVIFDRTFAITLALRLIAVVVAFIGVLSALMALQLERTRELGTLRAAGMTLPQLWRLTLLESGLMGATAGLLAIPTGLLLSLVLIYVINLRSFGWTIFFEPVPEVYLEALVAAVIAALLAAVYPMLRLGRLQVADALREE